MTVVYLSPHPYHTLVLCSPPNDPSKINCCVVKHIPQCVDDHATIQLQKLRTSDKKEIRKNG